MAKNKQPKPNRYVTPSFQWVRVKRPEAFAFDGVIITSRYLMQLLVEHINKTQGKSFTVEQFRIKDNSNGQPTADTETPGATPPAQTA